MKKRYAIPALCILALLLLPIVSIPRLRSDYVNELAIKRRYWTRPDVVMVGDSQIARGGVWGLRLGRDPLSTIVVAQGGFTLQQIDTAANEAISYHPKAFVVEAGTNDVLMGMKDLPSFVARYAALVRRLKAHDARVIVTLLPPNIDPETTAKVHLANAALAPVLREAGATIIDLSPLMESHGRAADGATVDGVHMTDPVYRKWAGLLREAIAA